MQYTEWPQKSVNLKHFLVLTGMFRLKRASQSAEQYHGVVTCALNMVDLLSSKYCKFGQWKKNRRILVYILLIYFGPRCISGGHGKDEEQFYI
jgi:hypothetical protein